MVYHKIRRTHRFEGVQELVRGVFGVFGFRTYGLTRWPSKCGDGRGGIHSGAFDEEFLEPWYELSKSGSDAEVRQTLPMRLDVLLNFATRSGNLHEVIEGQHAFTALNDEGEIAHRCVLVMITPFEVLAMNRFLGIRTTVLVWC